MAGNGAGDDQTASQLVVIGAGAPRSSTCISASCWRRGGSELPDGRLQLDMSAFHVADTAPTPGFPYPRR